MSIDAAYHSMIEASLAATGISDGMMHVHVGLAIYLGAQMLGGERRASLHALLIVLVAELFNEAMDRLFWGDWRWPDTRSDIVLTMLWPTLLYLAGRYRRWRWQKRRAGDALLAFAGAAFAPADAPRGSRT